MRKIKVGLIAMLVSFGLSAIVGLGSLLSTGGNIDTSVMSKATLAVPTLLVSLLTPLALILEIVAIVLIVRGSKYAGRTQRRMALLALWFFIAWAAANVFGFLPLTFFALKSGSLGVLRAGQGTKAVAALLQYAVPFLLVFRLTRGWARLTLWLGLVLTVVGNFATVALGASAMSLRAVSEPTIVSHVPTFAVDYTTGLYPLLLAMGYAGGLLYIASYLSLTVRFRTVGSLPGEGGAEQGGPDGPSRDG